MAPTGYPNHSYFPQSTEINCPHALGVLGFVLGTTQVKDHFLACSGSAVLCDFTVGFHRFNRISEPLADLSARRPLALEFVPRLIVLVSQFIA